MKNFKLSMLLFVFSFMLFSCSKDEDNATIIPAPTGILNLTGKVMAPNNSFPISRAKIRIYKDDVLISEKTSDAVGSFLADKLPSGNLRVELSKGKFKRNLDINLQDDYELTASQSNLTLLPKIAVVTGYYDEIEQVLVNIGVVDPLTGAPDFDILSGASRGVANVDVKSDSHQHGDMPTNRSATSLPPNVAFTFTELLSDPALLDDYDIIFLNCGANESLAANPVAVANLKSYIENGGIVYATDWMFKYIQAMFNGNDYLNFAQPERAGNSLTANAHVLNADLIVWLAALGIDVDPTIQINGFLSSWQMVDTFNATNVTNWLVADNVTYSGNFLIDKSLAFTFTHGEGGVFYSSFHTHGNDPSENVIRNMMNYFIFELSDL